MTNTRIRMAVAGSLFYLAAGGIAEAAKGVQKVAPANAPGNAAGNGGGNAAGNAQANAQRTISGVVLGVTHKNGGASFHLRTAQHHKKMGAVNPAAGAGGGVAGGNHHGHQFNVTAATHFGRQNGAPASLASLHQGERVRVQAAGHQAMNVLILSQHRTRGSFTRHRASTYRPHLYQQHAHPHTTHRRR